MSRKNRLNLPTTLKDKFSDLLGGKTPTTERLLKMLDRKELPMMDKDDVEKGREPLTPQMHAGIVAAASSVPIDEAATVAFAQENQARRIETGRTTLADRIEANRARGLNADAPPEDPVAAELADEAATPSWTGPEMTVTSSTPTSFTAAPATGPADAEIERMKAEGIAAMRGHTEKLERDTLQRLPQILRGGGGRLRSLEEAASILISEMQPSHQDAINDVVRETGKEPWQIVLGALALSADRQELHAGEFDPEWLNRGPGGGRPASVKEQKCQACGGVLPGDARRGQQFCCSFHGSNRFDHNEDCSLRHLEMRQGRWVDTRGSRV